MRNPCSLLLFVCIGCGGSTVVTSDQPIAGHDGGADSARSPMRALPAGGDPGSTPRTDPEPSPTPSPSGQPTPSSQPTPPPDVSPAPVAATHTRCGWLDGDDASNVSFVAHAAWFNAVHPKWYEVDANGNVGPVSTPDLASVVNAAHANHVKLMPMIDNPDAARLRIVFSSQANIAAHVQTLVTLVQQHGYDGMDFDYEHLWDKSDRPGFLSLMTQLAAAFHAHGWEISMALGAFATDDGNNAYDYQTLADNLDELHLMFYDYHYPAGDHMGPIAPLGWVEATLQHAQSTGHANKFIVGLPNYAIGLGWYDWLANGIALCIASVVEPTNEMLTCPYNTEGFSAGSAPHCLTQSLGTIWFEDLTSMDEKLQLAQKYGARGVTYWTIGNEIAGFFDLVQKYFP